MSEEYNNNLTNILKYFSEQIASDSGKEIIKDVLRDVDKSQKFYSYLKYNDDICNNKDLILMIHKDENYNA